LVTDDYQAGNRPVVDAEVVRHDQLIGGQVGPAVLRVLGNLQLFTDRLPLTPIHVVFETLTGKRFIKI
jgi:hypothetical protein